MVGSSDKQLFDPLVVICNFILPFNIELISVIRSQLLRLLLYMWLLRFTGISDYITIFMAAKCENDSDRPINLEPNKCEGWDSYSWNDLCEIIASEDEGSKVRLFGPLKRLVKDSPISVTRFLSE